jgi:hypothetical protein
MQRTEPSTEENPLQRSSRRDDGPVELELGDGSRLVLEEALGSPIICRIDGGRISLADTLRRRGHPFAGYRYLRDERHH